jgi:hypothetical protein
MDYTEAMRRLLLRQTSQATLSPEQAEGIVRGFRDAAVVARDGKTMLIDFDPCEMDTLRARLGGWLVTEAGAPLPVPDTCLHIKT